MTTAEKCEAILKRLVATANEGRTVALEHDFGGNTTTIHLGNSHTHCGVPDGDWEMLVESLYNSLHGGPGLSWHTED